MSTQPTAAIGPRYRLELLLGQGGMGSVYRAYDRLTAQHVALKIVLARADEGRDGGSARAAQSSAETVQLPDGLAPTEAGPGRIASPLTPQRESSVRIHVRGSAPRPSADPVWARMALAREFRTLASLRHPHIISVLDYGFIAQAQPFFTMELLEGAQTLGAAAGGLPPVQQALLLSQLLRALSYLHRHGILHRDLKPANVLILDGSEGPQCKLLDFGLARPRSHLHVNSGEIAGTISYMAPEMMRGKGSTESSDLFAVGVIAYELFARRHPFDRGDDLQLIRSALEEDPDWSLLPPRASLVELLKRLLAKDPARRPSAEEALVALCAAVGLPPPQETPALRESTLQAARFVGRDEPLAILRAALESARKGKGAVRLIGGESGVGKSRLMEEVRGYALVQGVLSVRGQAVSEAGAAFEPWREIVRTLCLSTELEALEASVLKSLLPDLESLLEREIPDAAELSPQAAQLRLLNTLESLLLRQSEPILLLLEDLHWADAESLALLRRLIPRCAERPILILASYRDDEKPALPEELPGGAVLKLQRLSAASISSLCRSMLGDSGCTPELVAFLEAETEGNVFFVIEVMRALAEEAGQLSAVSSHRLPRHVLTGGIQAIVQRRLQRLPEDARPLLRLAAIAGRQLDLELLRRFEPDLEPWLYLAADASVLEAIGPVWRFAHDKIRESLLDELEPAARQELHLEVAGALLALYAGSPAHAAAIAEHYQRGGDPARAAPHLIEAGWHALGQGATAQAAELLAQALLPASHRHLTREQAARAASGLIQATLALGRFVECMATYDRLTADVGRGPAVGARPLAQTVARVLARLVRSDPAPQPVRDEDRPLLRDLAYAARWVCEAYIWHGQLRKNLQTAMHGTELALVLGDRALTAYFLGLFSHMASQLSLHGVSRRLYTRGSQLLVGLPHSRVELDVRRVAGSRHLNAADWPLAIAESESLIALSRQLGDELALMTGLTLRLLAAFRLDDLATVDRLGPELYERSRRSQYDQFARTPLLYQALRALRRDEAALAHPLLVEALGYVRKTQDSPGRIMAEGLMSRCLLQLGRREEALAGALALLAFAQQARFTMDVVGEGLSAMAEVVLDHWQSGDATARQQLDEPLRRSLAALRRSALSFPGTVPRALLWHARAAWAHGATRLARELAALSQQRAERLHMPFDQELARTWRTRFAAPSGATGRSAPGLLLELHGIRQLL
ncbi:MAG: protein kinase [Polyangia bacterium]